MEGSSDHYLPNYPYYLLPDINYSDYTSDVSSRYVLLPFSQGMTQVMSETEAEESDTGLNYESLLTTSDQAYSKVNMDSQNLEMEEGDIAGPFDLGVAVTKTIDGEEDTEDSREAKLVVFASETLLDGQTDAMVSGGNSALFMNVVSQLVDHESTVSIEAKSMAVTYLTVTAGSAIFWGLLTVLILPLFLLILGGVIWFQRRKR